MIFDKEYFTQSKNYKESQDYRKKKYEGLALDIKKILNLKQNNILVDFGCATGLLLKELKNYCNCYGTDISEWAITFGRMNYGLTEELFYNDKSLLSIPNDYILMLDVLEHCPVEEINIILTKCEKNKTLKNIIVRIPVTHEEGKDYVLEISKNDKTHIQCRTKDWWETVFEDYKFVKEKEINEKNIYDSEGVLVWLLKKKK